MKSCNWFARAAATVGLLVGLSPGFLRAAPLTREVPEALKPWTSWVLWDQVDSDSPLPYHNPKQAWRLWPAQLTLAANVGGGQFDLKVSAFAEAWMPLPGNADYWPVDVTVDGARVPVVEHDGRPAVKLSAGQHAIAGKFRWQAIPQRITIPPAIGILALTIDGQSVPTPAWDAQGVLWLKRDASTEQTDKDFLAVKAYSLLEDGIPMWLHTEVELAVAGKSREELLGAVVPAGWQLSSLESPIPVAVDAAGALKAQVRAGKWTIKLTAFQANHPAEIAYPAGTKPAVSEQLVAFRSRPDLRTLEFYGMATVDVSQTPFPEKWRQFPVYRWETPKPFQFQERMRGMGQQTPAGLKIDRQLWLDSDGKNLTFHDEISGGMQKIWRLDVAPGQDLGSVRTRADGQLITRNPGNGALGVEIRDRALQLEATGRMACNRELSAAGWQTDVDNLSVTLNLPPGWRLFALFGADWVSGDWLTAWTLLDLFLLLIFTLAVFRLWGFAAALLAFVAFGLSYHEPGAPRYVWLVLLIPIALLRVVPAGWGHRLLSATKWATVLALVLLLVPFLGKQIQQGLYPQLEFLGDTMGAGTMTSSSGIADASRSSRRYSLKGSLSSEANVLAAPAKLQSLGNLQWDKNARIQTGPGVPEWSWRSVQFGWRGPVTASQTVKPILIPMQVERALTFARIALLLGLAAVLLNARGLRGRMFRKPPAAPAVAVALAALMLGLAPATHAQIPDTATLNTLRDRLLEKSDAFPHAAEIPHVTLTLRDHQLTMEAEIHTAVRTAVPLPGRLPSWSPVSVRVDGLPEISLQRNDGYLWIVLPAGIHRVHVDGRLGDLTDWQWTYHLRPRQVSVDAPGWQVGGIRPDGIPEAQVFFSRMRTTQPHEASYDRPDVQTAVAVERQLELGLVWQVRSTVKRLSPLGNAVALSIPLLPGENVLSSNAIVRDGRIDVRLGAQQAEFTWQSELAMVPQLTLATRAKDSWIEQWSLLASPVWNIGVTGLPPIFDESNPTLTPLWKPWPGETVTLEMKRPTAAEGATITVASGEHRVVLGKRQRTHALGLSLRCSLGEDFLIELPPAAEPTGLSHSGQSIPIRKDGNKVIIPLKPGEQNINLQWKTNTPLSEHASSGAVTLPVPSANLTTTIEVPANRWVLWTHGPLRGPAVRFWGILLGALLAAWILGRLATSPLRSYQWMLLAIGLTQIPLPVALVVVGWLFFLVWRGSDSFRWLPAWLHNTLQVGLILTTMVVLGIFVAVVAEGLLGNPKMFISGNGSSQYFLRWYEARCGSQLPEPSCVTISIWWYRLMMLLWALWLASALIGWLRWGWGQFSSGTCFRMPPPRSPKPSGPPPLPPALPVQAPVESAVPPMPPP